VASRRFGEDRALIGLRFEADVHRRHRCRWRRHREIPPKRGVNHLVEEGPLAIARLSHEGSRCVSAVFTKESAA
jgi:hypothetical protein